MNKYFPVPNLEIMVTNKCNMQCKYCFEKNKPNKKMTFEDILPVLNNSTAEEFYVFGGEPLIEIDLICDLIDEVKKTNVRDKQRMINSLRKITTNGTLIKKNIDKIKKYNLNCQISIDGYKEVNDLNRIYPNGKGSYDDILEAIDLCIEHNIEWSIHGVVNKESLSNLAEITKWFYDINLKRNLEVKKNIDWLKHNTFQIIFEENYTDHDIDILIEEFYKIAKWIKYDLNISEDDKKQFFHNWFYKHGGYCGAGLGLKTIDVEKQIYPCHRMIGLGEEVKEKYSLGKIDSKERTNIKFYNSLYYLKNNFKQMYSAIKTIDYRKKDSDMNWMMWCPVTNIETSGSIFYQNSKYHVMTVELGRAIEMMRQELF